MSQVLDMREQDYSFIGKGAIFNGTFHFKGPTRLAGEIEGEVAMEERFELVIERDGSFRGNLKGGPVEIYGIFQGTLHSLDTVTVYPSARVDGEIVAKNLVVHPGARINMDGKTSL